MSKRDEFVVPEGSDWKAGLAIAGSYYLGLVLFISGAIAYNMHNIKCTAPGCPQPTLTSNIK